MGQFGQTEQQQLANQYAQAGAQQQQGLQNRGLGNSTIANSIQTGLQQSQGLAETNLNEQIAQFQNQAVQNAGQNLYGTWNQMGQQSAAGLANIGQAGINAQQGIGQQYLGMVGQQGVQNASTNQSFGNSGTNFAQQYAPQYGGGAIGGVAGAAAPPAGQSILRPQGTSGGSQLGNMYAGGPTGGLGNANIGGGSIASYYPGGAQPSPTQQQAQDPYGIQSGANTAAGAAMQGFSDYGGWYGG